MSPTWDFDRLRPRKETRSVPVTQGAIIPLNSFFDGFIHSKGTGWNIPGRRSSLVTEHERTSLVASQPVAEESLPLPTLVMSRHSEG